MDLRVVLPATTAGLNALAFVLLIAALVAIRGGDRERHRRLMLTNLGVAAVFLASYISQLVLFGHHRFPGDDWVRSVFVWLLASHVLLAMSLVPLVPVTLYLALRQRFDGHRRVARFTAPIWIYVSLTGVLVYWMNNHLRPVLP